MLTKVEIRLSGQGLYIANLKMFLVKEQGLQYIGWSPKLWQIRSRLILTKVAHLLANISFFENIEWPTRFAFQKLQIKGNDLFIICVTTKFIYFLIFLVFLPNYKRSINFPFVQHVFYECRAIVGFYPYCKIITLYFLDSFWVSMSEFSVL